MTVHTSKSGPTENFKKNRTADAPQSLGKGRLQHATAGATAPPEGLHRVIPRADVRPTGSSTPGSGGATNDHPPKVPANGSPLASGGQAGPAPPETKKNRGAI